MGEMLSVKREQINKKMLTQTAKTFDILWLILIATKGSMIWLWETKTDISFGKNASIILL